jgi:hypothetical protein
MNSTNSSPYSSQPTAMAIARQTSRILPGASCPMKRIRRACVAAFVLGFVNAAEMEQRGAASFLGTHSLLYVVLDHHLEMKPELLMHLHLEPTLAEQGSQTW